MIQRKVILIACGAVVAIGIGGIGLLGKKVLDNQVFASTCAAKQVAIPDNPRQVAESITVKVFSGNGGGSGTLIAKQGQVYTVLTNQHVLTSGEPYRIQTPDGRIYSAEIPKNVNFGKNDLALLQFRADADYTVAVLAETGFQGNLAVNQEVFAAGFPFDGEKLTFNSGKISLLPDKTLQGGYRIGYTNDIQKGMSGGPILNSQGQVIGINGVHAYALFGDPYVFEDGSKPSDTQKQQMTRLSWGVPIQIVVQAVPELAATNLVKNVERIAQEITVLITYPNGNGSGVIIAQRGNTYYVLTANHVVRDETQYEVTTPDGRCYPVNYRTVKKFEGVDLAVLEFKSDRSYRVATLGKYDLGKETKVVFVSGWPGSIVNNENTRSLFTGGIVFDKESLYLRSKDFFSFKDGYELVYSNITVGGVSGGPVLDIRGRVIGIHGRAEGEVTVDDAGQVHPIYLGYSLGVPVNKFLRIFTKVGIEPELLKIETSAPQKVPLEELETVLKFLSGNVADGVPDDMIVLDDALAWLNLGNRMWRVFRLKEALLAFRMATQTKPNLYQAWYAEGIALSSFNQYQAAIASFDKATQIKPNFSLAWRGLGGAFRELKKYHEALASYEKGIEYNPEDIFLQVARGEVLSELNRYHEARDVYTKVIQVNPHPFVYKDRGRLQTILGDYQAAVTDFTKAIELMPDLAEAYTGRGSVLIVIGKNQEALTDFNQAIRLAPNDSKAYKLRGILLNKIGRNQEALADFNQALLLNPKDVEAYSIRGPVYAELGEFQNALGDCNKAIFMELDNALAYVCRARVRLLMRDAQGFIEDTQKAAKLSHEQGNIAGHQKLQGLLENIRIAPQN